MSKKLEDLVGSEEANVTASHEAGHALLVHLSPAMLHVNGTLLLQDEESRTGRASKGPHV